LTFAGKEKWVPAYIKSLISEINKRGRKFKNYEIETIYFGGGTPSLIPAELIKNIIQALRANFRVKRGAEISIESNPESVTLEKLMIYKKAGINRFSLGIQSFNKATLRQISRPHDSETIFKALEIFKKAEKVAPPRRTNRLASPRLGLGADFIMGLPGQTLPSFKEEVETILTFKPTHLSYYFLSYDTPKIDKFIKDCPNEDTQIRMYNFLCKRLKKAGFLHYEVSNFARLGFECKHNQRYWEQKDYLGLGLGAHSIVGDEIWENGKDLEKYLRDPMKTEGHMKIDAELKRMEYIMLGLRTNRGIDFGEYIKLGGDKTELLENALKYTKSGLLKKSSTHLKATEKGFLILDSIIKVLI
jgi:oxygen-independent coproporphyrinogen-3 oxidase